MLNNSDTRLIHKILADAEKKIKDELNVRCKVEVTEVISYGISDYYINHCLNRWQVNMAYIRQKKGDKHHIALRQILCFILRKETKLTYNQIAKLLNIKDHCTVINAIKRFNNYIATNDPYLLQFYNPVKELVTTIPHK